MSKSDDFRRRAKEADRRGTTTKSLREGANEHKRAEALNNLADNEDWLDGKSYPMAEKK